jgi:UDP-N-acetylglucosamine 2-epimerase
VNVGNRQKGRLRGENVIDTDYDTEKIYLATRKCLYDEEFRELCQASHNPYGTGNVGKKIADVLAAIDIDLKLLQKKMTY